MATPRLTSMRQAVWNAIDNYAPLDDVFKHKERHEDIGALKGTEWVPNMGQIPALEIRPASVGSPWFTNQNQKISYSLQVAVWSRTRDTRGLERLWELLLRAFWQATPTGTTQTYVMAATDNATFAAGMSFEEVPAANGSPSVWRSTGLIQLEKLWNPRLETEALT